MTTTPPTRRVAGIQIAAGMTIIDHHDTRWLVLDLQRDFRDDGQHRLWVIPHTSAHRISDQNRLGAQNTMIHPDVDILGPFTTRQLCAATWHTDSPIPQPGTEARYDITPRRLSFLHLTPGMAVEAPDNREFAVHRVSNNYDGPGRHLAWVTPLRGSDDTMERLGPYTTRQAQATLWHLATHPPHDTTIDPALSRPLTTDPFLSRPTPPPHTTHNIGRTR